MDADGLGQRLQFFFIEVLTGLIRIGFYFINRQQPVRTLLGGFFREISQQRAKSPTLAFVVCQQNHLFIIPVES